MLMLIGQRLMEATMACRVAAAALLYSTSEDEVARQKALKAVLRFIVPSDDLDLSMDIEKLMAAISVPVGAMNRLLCHVFQDIEHQLSNGKPISHEDMAKSGVALRNYVLGLLQENLLMEWDFREVAEYLAGKSILDFGCGGLSLLIKLATKGVRIAAYTGFDRKEVLDIATKDTELLEELSRDMFYTRYLSRESQLKQYDTIWIGNVLHCKPREERESILACLDRHLRLEGHLIVSEVIPDTLYGDLFDLQMHCRTEAGGVIRPDKLNTLVSPLGYELRTLTTVNPIHYAVVYQKVAK